MNVFVKLKDKKKWYKTGDIRFLKMSNGLFRMCIGRRDNQIKISGRRIEIGEIEFVLSKFKKTKNSIVIPIRDKREIVIGCVAFITESINKDEELEIRSKSIEYLDRVFFPKKFITIEKFPLNNSGKIDRRKLEKITLNL